MKKFVGVFASLLVLVSFSVVFAAGSCTYRRNPNRVIPKGKYEVEWVCAGDTSGDVTVTCSDETLATGFTELNPCEGLYGTIVNIQIIPSATAAPDTLWDLELRDSAASTIDYLNGLGDNLSATDAKNDFPLTANGGPVVIFNRSLIPFADNLGTDGDESFTLRIVLDNE